MNVRHLLVLALTLAATATATAATAQPTLAAASAPESGAQPCASGTLRRGSACIPLRSATDAEIREYLVRESIRAYSGNCPCPYNVDRAGRRCGGRSAYSRPGGASPWCYPSDVPDTAVRRARGGAR